MFGCVCARGNLWRVYMIASESFVLVIFASKPAKGGGGGVYRWRRIRESSSSLERTAGARSILKLRDTLRESKLFIYICRKSVYVW